MELFRDFWYNNNTNKTTDYLFISTIYVAKISTVTTGAMNNVKSNVFPCCYELI